MTGQVGTEFTFFITVTGCSSSNKLPSFKVADGKLPPGTKIFNFGVQTELINGVPKTAGTFTFTVQVKDETRATDTETFRPFGAGIRRITPFPSPFAKRAFMAPMSLAGW